MSDTQKHKKANVPNLRFPGFEGDWKNTNLGDLGKIVGGGTPDTAVADYWNGDIMWFTPSEVGKEKFVNESNRRISHEGLKNSSAKLLPKNSILLTSRATVGECSINLTECCTNQGFQSFIPNITIVNTEFLYYRLLTHKKDFIRKACGSTFIEVSARQIANIASRIPTMKEQEKMASFLAIIDQRLALQSKIIDRLKMTELQIRESIFRGLSSPCVPLSSICIRIKERNDENNTNVLSISARDGLISQLDFFNKSVASENLSNYFLLRRGDFAYNKSYSSEHPWGAIKHLERYEKGVLSPLYICFRPNAKLVNSDFLQHYFETSLWHKYIAEIAVEGARNHGLLNMSIGDFFSMPIPLPSLEEQKAMAKRLSAFQRWKEIEESYYKTLLFQKQFFLKNLFI